MIIIAFCSTLYLLMLFHLIPFELSVLLTITTLVGTLAIMAYYTLLAHHHPLQKRISAVLQRYEHDHEPCRSSQIILNLSQEPISTSPQFEGFSLGFQGCMIQTFIADHVFYLVVSHPQNHLSSLAHLWSEIGKCHITFQDLCLAINPEQLKTLSSKLSQEWLFVQNLLRSSPQVSLLVHDKPLSQSVYYAQEYGTLPDPISLSSSRLLPSLQESNVQLNRWIQSLYHQRHDLCIYPPISPEQKTHLFRLPHILESYKSSLLDTVIFSKQHHIPLHAIHFGINQLSYPKASLYQHYRLPTLAFILTTLALGLYATQTLIQTKLHTKLSQTEYQDLAKKLYTLERYPQYKTIQSYHLSKLKHQYLLNHPQAKTYTYLFSHHKKSNPKLKVELIHKLTENTLDQHLVEFLSRHWFDQAHQERPSLSDLAPVVPEMHIFDVCQIWEPGNTADCVQKLSKIKSYQTYDLMLQKLEKTLIPIDPEHHEQTLRQLGYLIQNPKHIGQEALKQLDHIMEKIRLDGHSSLLNKAKEIQSIIHLLQSPNGQYILHKIQSLHELHHTIDSDEKALQTLQKAYLSDRHILRELKALGQNLSPHQAKWLENMTKPLVNTISEKANHYLQYTWNEVIYPELLNLQSKFPFSGSLSISPYELHQTFHLVDTYFDQYLRMFIQEEDGDLVLKPYALGIEIPEHILTLYIYTKILGSSLDIKEDHFHAAWAISLKEMPHPIESIYVHAANKKQPLKLHKGTVLHWDSRYPIGFDIVLQNGETISVIQNNDWSVLSLFSQFKQSSPYCYQYHSDDHSWQFSIEAKPQYPINLLDSELIQGLPLSPW